jgi:hypothetical protein
MRCIDDFLSGTRHSLAALNHLATLPVTASA